MANRIGRFHKLGKHNRKRPDMTTNIFTVPVSILFCYNTDDINIDMTINSTSTNTILSVQNRQFTICMASHTRKFRSI